MYTDHGAHVLICLACAAAGGTAGEPEPRVPPSWEAHCHEPASSGRHLIQEGGIYLWTCCSGQYLPPLPHPTACCAMSHHSFMLCLILLVGKAQMHWRSRCRRDQSWCSGPQTTGFFCDKADKRSMLGLKNASVFCQSDSAVAIASRQLVQLDTCCKNMWGRQ